MAQGTLGWILMHELSQLINVLKGKMPLVGPRPEVEKDVTAFRNQYKNILTIKTV